MTEDNPWRSGRLRYQPEMPSVVPAKRTYKSFYVFCPRCGDSRLKLDPEETLPERGGKKFVDAHCEGCWLTFNLSQALFVTTYRGDLV